MHIMVDIETLGTKPGSAILSIGAAEFDLHRGLTGRELYQTVSLDSCRSEGMAIDPDTVAWWMQQSDAARREAFSGTAPLTDALCLLTGFVFPLVGPHDAIRIWAHSPKFDAAHLEEAYRIVGLAAPWSFRSTRDTRTLFDLADFDLGSIERVGTHHNALDDCRFQAKAVVAAYAKIRGNAS